MFPSLGTCSPDMVVKLDDSWVQQPLAQMGREPLQNVMAGVVSGRDSSSSAFCWCWLSILIVRAHRILVPTEPDPRADRLSVAVGTDLGEAGQGMVFVGDRGRKFLRC